MTITRRRKKRPSELKHKIRPGPPEPMRLDDALDEFDGYWMVFRTIEPDEQGNHLGIVVALGGPEEPMRKLYNDLAETEPRRNLRVRFCDGHYLRTGEEVRRALKEF